MDVDASPPRVLLIDDHPDVAELMALLVRAACPAAATRVALDGCAGLELASAWWPHLVITDIDMPLLSGIEAALQMRTLLAECPPLIVAVTGNPRWREEPMAIAVFDAVLVKPIDFQVLEPYLRRAELLALG